MNAKSNRCIVTAAVTGEEKNLFSAMARDLDVSCDVLMRRLIRHFLNVRISWEELFKPNRASKKNETDIAAAKSYMRTHVNPDQYAALTQIAEEWGSTASVVLRKLVLSYIAGDIERRDIW
jgi:hypothetical protein